MSVDLGKTNGDVWSATDVDALEAAINLGLNVCTSSTRPGSPSTGTVIYETDTKNTRVYNGSTWASFIAPAAGAATTWTPTITQSGSVTCTVTRAVYQRIGRWIKGNAYLTVTGTGTANNVITIGGLPFTGAAGQVIVGQSVIVDISASTNYAGLVAMPTTTTFSFVPCAVVSAINTYDGLTASNGFSAALASTDIVAFSFEYEAAADA